MTADSDTRSGEGPQAAVNQIQVLLRELRAEGLIHKVGVTNAARWFPGAGRANCKLGEPRS